MIDVVSDKLAAGPVVITEGERNDQREDHRLRNVMAWLPSQSPGKTPLPLCSCSVIMPAVCATPTRSSNALMRKLG